MILKRSPTLRLNDVNNFAALDFLKFFCALLVAAIHIEPFGSSGFLVSFCAKNTLPRIAVPIFFIISGFFLFQKLTDKIKIRQYSLRILLLYAVYSIIHLPFVISDINKGRTDFSDFVRSIFLYRSYVHLWYLLTLFFTVIIIYLLYNKLKISLKTQLIIFGILHIIGILISLYRPVFDSTFLKSIIDRYYKIFFDIENCVFFGFYVVLGCFIREKSDKIPNRNYGLYAAVFFCLFAGEMTANRLLFQKADYQISFLLVPTVLFIFLAACFCGVSEKAKKHALFFRRQSTIIYLWHMVFFNVLNKLFFVLTGIRLSRFVLYAATVTISFVFAAIWIKLSENKRFAFLKYLS